MSSDQAQSILKVLTAAFSSKEKRTEALKLYAKLLGDLDYDLAGKAARTIIETSEFWPKWAVFKRTYNEHAAVARRAKEHSEIETLLSEPTDEERREQLERMQQFIADRWPAVAA